MIVRKTAKKGINITKLNGQDLPMATLENVAGVAGLAFLEASDYDGGFEIEIYKKIKAGSGIGSSAASSTGAVWAMNELLGKPFSTLELVKFAMEGERLASGVAHADNVAPALFGGFTLVRSYEPLDVVPIPCPSELFATVIHPQIEIKTSDSRKILKTTITLKDGIKQWGNVGGLIAGLFTDDYGLIGRSLEDHIVEPIRSILIPGFDDVKKMAVEAGADAALLKRCVDGDPHQAGDIGLGFRFAMAAIHGNPEVDDLKQQIETKYGKRAVIAAAFAAGSGRFYPVFKRGLGYGHACSRLEFGGVPELEMAQ